MDDIRLKISFERWERYFIMMLSEYKETCKSLSSDRYDRFYQEIDSAYVGFIGDRKTFCNIIDNFVFDNMFIELDSFLCTCQESGNSFPDSYGKGYRFMVYPLTTDFDFCIKGKHMFDNEICAMLEGEYFHDHYLDLSIPIDYNIETYTDYK